MQQTQTTLNGIADQKNSLHVDIAKLETKVEDLEEEVYHELHQSLAQVLERVVSTHTVDSLDTVQADIDKLKYQSREMMLLLENLVIESYYLKNAILTNTDAKARAWALPMASSPRLCI